MPAKFTDAKGRIWSPRLTLDVMEAYDRGADGVGVVEALAMQNTGALYKLHAMMPLLFEAVRDQAKERDVKYEEFRQQFANPRVLRDATQALTDAVNDAFPAALEDEEEGVEVPTSGGGESSTSSPPSPG